MALSDSAHAAHLGTFALASRAVSARDLVAFGAGFENFEQVLVAARSGEVPDASPTWLRELGRITYQLPVPDAADIALVLYEAALRVNPQMIFRDIDSSVYLEASLARRGPEVTVAQMHRHRRLRPIESDFFNIDLQGLRHGYGSQEWVDALNQQIFTPSGLSPIELSEGDGPVFDRLASHVTHTVETGPLISVIMLTYRRRDEIRVAVQSILNQTWKNLELIIVDDASGDEYAPALEEVRAMDPRISVVRMKENGGAYVGRNEALQLARGEYVTFQDDDDWSHPERLERQVSLLVDDPDIALTLSLCARATEDMSFRYRASHVVRRNASSLMFRRADIRRVGLYDTVRKAADSEFIERLLAVTGGRQGLVEDVLALVRLSIGSLSRADFAVGWQHPARVEYRESYRHYHRELRRGAAEVDPPAERRRFPAPRRFLEAGEPAGVKSKVDVLYLTDWREMGATTAVHAQHVSELVSAGHSVGIAHVADVRLGGKGLEPLAASIRELISNRQVVRVLPGDEVAVHSLMVDDAGAIDSLAADGWVCTVERAVVVARSVPGELDPASTWDVGSTLQHLTEVFAPEQVSWLATQDEELAALDQLGLEPSSLDLRGAAVGIPGAKRVAGARAVPHVGYYVPRGESLHSGRESLLDVMSGEKSADIRLYAGVRTGRERMASRGATWLVFAPSDIPFQDYLRQLDFYLAGDGGQHPADQVLAALQAAHAGCVVIADPRLEPQLGEAAVYRNSADARSTVVELFGNDQAYQEQVQRALSWCMEVRVRYSNTVQKSERQGTV